MRKSLGKVIACLRKIKRLLSSHSTPLPVVHHSLNDSFVPTGVTHQKGISISSWFKETTVCDTHAGIVLHTILFLLSLMVNKSVLA